MGTEADLVHEKAFLKQETADEYYGRLDGMLPWDKYRWAPGMSPLKQLVYFYDKEQRETNKSPVLEELVTIIERRFNTKAEVTWCNKFRDSKDLITWHQDRYGMSLFVFSFGASRPVEVRKKVGMFSSSSKKAERSLLVEHGDLYRWTDDYDKMHEHRVPPAVTDGPRISILILTRPAGSVNAPAHLQKKMLMAPIYSGQCSKCQGFLAQAKGSIYPTRKCKQCKKSYAYTTWS
mmetsp:Transcript_15902/g.17953  ORF Transcript_15902/g.17953 Transcript_15902/m.17953 type:complete len:234 (+) Transcript_15902:323-1024(+)